jgi:hypothetical protein
MSCFMFFLVKKNNWPPINCGCIHPCFYQDFDVDISLEYKKIVKTMYYLWLGKANFTRIFQVSLINVLQCPYWLMLFS